MARVEILLITSILAFCSIVYELLLSNTLAIVTGNYIWWQSLTVGVYIGGLGLGAYYSDRLLDAYKSLMKIELGLSFLGSICDRFLINRYMPSDTAAINNTIKTRDDFPA